jgi:aminoglycoside phosphotransferase family enzyme/predicted kinase
METLNLVEAMGRPGFYPHRPEGVELVETHISWVFLAGPLVYKVKKPVVFPFLDYGTLERRRALCREEVRLNRRLAPSIYRGVRALVRRGGGWALADDPDDPRACEYAVEMRRFDSTTTLAARLARGEATAEQLRAIGRRLADFHERAEPVAARVGWPAHLARSLDENFETLLSFAGSAVDGRELAAAERFISAFLVARRDELAGRAAAGRVRDCHGDLRAEHVIFGEQGVEVFDCVEFSPALREIDVAADLAFLVMDLAAAGREDLARELVGAYRDAGGDPGDEALLHFFAVYRAWVRAKVACLRADELDDDRRRAAALSEARGLAALARRLAWRARAPLPLVVCGGAASGKSHLARHLADVTGLAHLNSDVVRKELLGIAPAERAPASAYSAEMNARTYAELGRRAGGEITAGRSVLVDATFRYRRDREAFTAALGDRELIFVECLAPAAVVAERAAAREGDPSRVSDAGGELAERQRREFEPLDEVRADRHLVLRTDRAVEEIADDVEALLDARRQ